MKKALMQWLKKQIYYAFWVYVPFFVMVIFAVLALKSIAAFIVLTMAYVFFRK